MSPGTRTFSAGRFAMTLDGAPVGALSSVSGGGIFAEVIAGRSSGPFAEKHVGPPQYEDIAIEVGAGAGQAITSSIDDLLAGKATRRSGTVELADGNLNVKSVLQFENAPLAELGFPTFDGSSKDAAFLSLRFRPESLRRTKGSGKLTGKVGAKQKRWLASNFAFTLGDLPTKRVSKIDAFTIRQQVAAESIGEVRERRKQAGTVEIPNLKVTFSEADVAKWQEWFDDFVVQGNSGQEQELSGRLAFLDPTLKNEIGAVELQNVGIFRLAPEPAAAGKESVRRWVAELYVERMTFELKDVDA